MNIVILSGRLGGDAKQISYGKDNKTFVKANIAVNVGYGENKKTVWHDLVIFGKNQENALRLMKKGFRLQIQGTLESRAVEGSHPRVSVVVDKFEMLDYEKKQTNEEIPF
jgi:single-strand DNA-binding protein